MEAWLLRIHWEAEALLGPFVWYFKLKKISDLWSQNIEESAVIAKRSAPLSELFSGSLQL